MAIVGWAEKVLGSTSEIQKSVGLVRDVFMESGGTELAFKPMRFWLLEKKKENISRKGKHG